jgi:NADH-quinone oxidoreductase subunit F
VLDDKDRIFTNLYGQQDWGVDAAMKRGDWDDTKGLLARGPDAIIDAIKASGLRGRGGAGFPTGMKWSFMPKEPKPGKPSFLVINADESEPGSCKDREIIRHDPHKLIEGALVAGFAMRARAAYIYIRGEYIREAETLFAAVAQAYDRGLIGKNACGSGYDFDVFVHRGAGAYICRRRDRDAGEPGGQEGPAASEAAVPGRASASMAARPRSTTSNRSRSRPPSCAAARSGSPHRRPKNEGTKLFQISGHVNKPCVVEDAMGIPFRELIERHAGGIAVAGTICSAVLPGRLVGAAGARAPDHRRADGLSTGCAISSPDSAPRRSSSWTSPTDIVRAITRISYFYKHESCGQCTPCREGTGWMWRVMERLREGQCRNPRDRHARRGHPPDRGPHHLRARRRRRLADPGPDPPLPPELERRIVEKNGGTMLEAAE